MNSFNEGGVFFFYKYLQTKHKKWFFSVTIYLARKKFIFPGRYLKADHFGKKNWTRVVGHSKMLRGRGV